MVAMLMTVRRVEGEGLASKPYRGVMGFEPWNAEDDVVSRVGDVESIGFRF